jgi:hypothetical protein
MTREQHKKLAELLQLFNTSEPEQIEDFDKNRWRPFLASLSSDKDRVFALSAYFDQANYNLSQIVIRLGQLSEEELRELRPALEGFVELEKAFEAVSKRA